MTDPGFDPAEGAQGSREPTAGEVTAQMGRVLASPDFVQSTRLRKFLSFVVEETLAGRAESLKEYTIALAVFERDDSFDPQTSSIVRVEASRLRRRLDKYNGLEGRNDPVQISLPVGSYVPVFHAAAQDTLPSEAAPDGPASAGRLGSGPVRVAGLLSALVVLGGAAFLLFGSFDTAKEVRPAPEAAGFTEGASVAVLPLRNLSGDAAQDYFSDGITDALITRLANKASARVISMTSVMGYKNINRPIADIARELNVSHVIEGSVLRVGDQVRITAQLIEAETDSHLWAESYERSMADVLAIQEEVVRRIVLSLPGPVADPRDAEPNEAPAVDPTAYEAQLRGRFFRNQMTEAGFKKSITYFQQAIETEPDYALAYSGMASCFCLLSGQGFELVRPSEAMPAAKAAASKALELDDTLAEPYAFLGFIRLKYDWDWPGAEETLLHAMQLNPSYAQARLFYSTYLEAMGQQDEAVRQAEQTRSIDPLSAAANVNLGWQYLQAGRLDEAKRVFDGIAELNPHFWSLHWGLGHYYRQKGLYEEAIAAFRTSVDAGGGHTLPLKDLGYTYAVSGRAAEARDILERLETLSQESYVSPYNMATVHVGLGEIDEAFARLDEALEERARSLVWLKVAKEYTGLHADPRFKALLRRVGLPE